MSNPAERDVDALVQRILVEADDPGSPTVEQMRARVAALPPVEQESLRERLRREHVPILTYGVPPPPASESDRRSTAAGA